MDRADAVIEITEWVEVPRKNLTADNSTSSTTNSSLETDPKNASDENKQVDEGIGNASNSTTSNNDVVADLGMEKKLKKRTFRVPLKVLKLLSIFVHILCFHFLEGISWLQFLSSFYV